MMTPVPPSTNANPLTPRSEAVAIQTWLVAQRNNDATPNQICRDLVSQGWDADTAASASLRSLRRSDRHQVLYNSLCWSAGLGSLGAGSAAHLALTPHHDPIQLASAITLMLVAAPIAVYSGVLARATEASDAHALWSPIRRSLFGILAACSAIVGLVRLLHYTFSAVAAAVGARNYEFTASSVVQVLVTLSIAGPLCWWSSTEWRRSNVAVRSLTTITSESTNSSSDNKR